MLIGRKTEQQELLRAFNSEYSEFVAVTGRRRVGKTFLVRETFNYQFTFQHSGLAGQDTRSQLRAFRASLLKSGMKKCKVPVNWFEAFFLLSEFLDSRQEGKKVVFIDELPWMDASRSNFVAALEHFWNGYASARKDVLLIVCGSATSWIINKVFRNHGGLHNRVTYRIHLAPFTLCECAQYAQSLHLTMSEYDVLEAYMVMGGVPFYWSQLERGKSVAQNVDALFFDPKGPLHYEYNELYDSLFKNPQPYMKVVEALGTKKCGLTRDEIIARASLSSNGMLTRVLQDLEACGFVRKYGSVGAARGRAVYQLIDNYTLFYFKFLHNARAVSSNFWSATVNTPGRNAWQGLAFERVCLQHVAQIKRALGIAGVATEEFAWSSTEAGAGAQIDLVIDRADHVVDLCEMKFSASHYAITKKDDENLRHKVGVFRQATKSSKAIHVVLVTPFGAAENQYRFSVQNVVTADDLFKE